MTLAGKSILAIDDDPSVAEMMADTLASSGAAVKIAATVKDGLAALQTGKFDLILLDYVISEKVAEQFLSKAAAQGSGADVPVIIVSGHGENLTLERFGNYAQVKAVLSKPFDPGVLLSLAARAIR
ncbi:MAG: response regulator [Planctomycetes bacterium]|nr:response regulator [Planctomycetota bacterium]